MSAELTTAELEAMVCESCGHVAVNHIAMANACSECFKLLEVGIRRTLADVCPRFTPKGSDQAKAEEFWGVHPWQQETKEG